MSFEESDPEDNCCDEDEGEIVDWQLPLCFMKKRHKENIIGSLPLAQTWRMKERMKTVSVALVLCLNVGVDPPDIVKTTPCARMECWIDPTVLGPQKALEAIGNKLQEQYERWQPRARYKQTLDPTVEEVKKLCTSLRRNAKEERVLFHYNGHGVPKPTVNGEVWVFNKSYTQYIPLSVYDLQTWMGSPSIYVYDCSNAGVILKSFNQFAQQRELEYERCLAQGTPMPVPLPVKNCIQLAACAANQILPMSPDLPADLFTACLTTPIKIALRWFCQQRRGQLIPGVTLDMIEKIPGRLNDRRTPLGELNWIFTAVTDTIAWNSLPRELFQKLFRQDLLVASLFRNFLLAERILRSYNCTPVSNPKLPPTYMHPMWHAWDLAVDLCLSQLPDVSEKGATYQHSPFFAEQLTAFQVWLAMGSSTRPPPEQLPIVLQVLLSQVHRLRALDLLGRFLDLGPWAVNRALSVGIFPYVLKLLQSSARELKPLLVFIWAKILAVDSSCQTDLVKDNGHKYFLSVLADPYMPAEHRTMAAFVLAMIVNDHGNGQEACLQGNLIAICLEQVQDPHPLLRQWLAICLGRLWTSYDAARWCGVRDNAHDKLYCLLNDPLPEVRASVVYALGRFIANTGDRSDHANQIDFGVAMNLSGLTYDGSPLVRKELVVALYGLVIQFDSNFGVVALQFLEEDRQKETSAVPVQPAITPTGWIVVGTGSSPNLAQPHFEQLILATSPRGGKRSTGAIKTSFSTNQLSSLAAPPLGVIGAPAIVPSANISPAMIQYSSSIGSTGSIDSLPSLRRNSSASSLSLTSQTNVYTAVWKSLLNLAVDPYSGVSEKARKITNGITLKATMMAHPRAVTGAPIPSSLSAPSSPDTRQYYLNPEITYTGTSSSPLVQNLPHEIARPVALRPGEQPPPARPQNPAPIGSQFPHSYEFHVKRRMFDKGPDESIAQGEEEDEDSEEETEPGKPATINTEFAEWCASYFAESVMKPPEEHDPNSHLHQEREWRFLRNSKVRKEACLQQQTARKQLPSRKGESRLDDQIFINKNIHGAPNVLKFHPYEPQLAVADRLGVSIWDWEQGARLHHFSNHNPKHSRITALEFLNAHDLTLLLTGSDDGAIRVFRNYDGCDGKTQLVTALQALSSLLPSTRGSGSGMVVSWEQETGVLMASGDVRHIRVWDTQREMKLQDIPTGADSCVTSLSCDSVGRSLLIAGCGDGSVRLYDRRLPTNDSRVMTLREHTGWVTSVFLQKSGEGNIISGSVDGDVKFWDPRFTESVKTVHTVDNLTSFQVHSQAQLLASGSANQVIRVFNMEGDAVSTVRYHDGFMGQRIGPVTCMDFHPHRVHLAAGSIDSLISIYSTEKKAK